MADKVYVCLTRSDIPSGKLQVLDLEPNESQRNGVYTTPGQTKYLRQPQNDTVATYVGGAGKIYTTAEYKGVAAYILDNVASGATANAITASQANACGLALLVALRAGADMEIADVNAILVANVVAATALVGGSSTGVLEDLLKVLSGAEYVLPANHYSALNAGGALQPAGGAFDTTTYRQTYKTSSLILSTAVGMISKYKSASFEYDGVAGDAVIVYGDTGLPL